MVPEAKPTPRGDQDSGKLVQFMRDNEDIFQELFNRIGEAALQDDMEKFGMFVFAIEQILKDAIVLSSKFGKGAANA